MSHGEIKEKYVTHDERLEGRKEGRKRIQGTENTPELTHMKGRATMQMN